MHLITLNAFASLVALACHSSKLSAVPLSVVSTSGDTVKCLREPNSRESANSFLISGASAPLLIDAGWSDAAEIPQHMQGPVENATKVATHFHYDHTRQWRRMSHLAISRSQASLCDGLKCALGRWESINKTEPFLVERIFDSSGSFAGGLVPLACEGHSHSDQCFLHTLTKTLFLGDIFYPGPIFAFLPGGSASGITKTLATMLERHDWTRVGLTHGDCFASRAVVQAFFDRLSQVAHGRPRAHWDFSFWLPLKRLDLDGNSVFVRPF